MNWKIQAVAALSDDFAPRVFGRQELVSFMQDNGIEVPLRTLLRGLREWEQARLVQRVSQGVYLNTQQSLPTVMPHEAAHFLRNEAVLSLNYVLGNAGVLNNPSHWVTAIVPSSSTKAPTEVEMDNGLVFRFAYVQDAFFDPALGKDALDPFAVVPTASAEKALLDLLYLSSSARGARRWSLPPSHDWDIGGLDMDKLNRLAEKLSMQQPLADFVEGLASETRVSVSRRPR